MGTVTIGRTYFDALLRRAHFHTSGHEFELAPDLLSNVVVSKAEYDHLQQSSQDFALLKSALFRGGLTMDTLNTLLASENEVSNDSPAHYDSITEKTQMRPEMTPVTTQESSSKDSLLFSEDDTETGSDRLGLPRPRPLQRTYSSGQTESYMDDLSDEEQENHPQRAHRERTQGEDQRTILIGNLPERTTYKDIADVVRGGRLLDIFIRKDRSATVSFFEGAADFLAYVKRNDVYLYAKRLEFRWADRQFQILPHILDKVAAGVSRNLVVRGVAGKVTEQQIRDQLAHIHNLFVVDLYFWKGDAYISTNSVRNALHAKPCMLSRAMYKGTRIDWAPDECAAPVPKPNMTARAPDLRTVRTPLLMANTYAPLDTGSEVDAEPRAGAFMPNGIRPKHSDWASAAVA